MVTTLDLVATCVMCVVVAGSTFHAWWETFGPPRKKRRYENERVEDMALRAAHNSEGAA